MFIVKKKVTFKTPEGIRELPPGDTFKSRDLETLSLLLKQGIIAPYCYWLGQPVAECPITCINRVTICKHWEEWLEIRFSSNSTSPNIRNNRNQ